jgi:uncharacterized protein
VFNKIRNSFSHWIVDHPYLSLFTGVILCLSLGIGLKNFKANFTSRIWFGPETEYIKRVDAFEKNFGSDQFIALGMFHKDTVLTQKAIDINRELTEQLWLLPDVIRVESLASYNYIQTKDDEILIEPLIDEETTPAQVKYRVDNSKELDDFFISQNRKLVFFHLQIKPFFNTTPDYSKLMHKLDIVLEPYKKRGMKFLNIGSATITYAFRSTAKEDNQKILPMLFIIVLIMLAFYFKSINGVLIPIFVSLSTIGATLGLMGHLGYTFNSILGAIPGVILAICLADTVHLLTTYAGKIADGVTRKEALLYSMDKNFLATILTSVTTSISFFTIAYTELVPIHDLGVLSGVGCLLAWIFTYFFLPSMILLLPRSFNRAFSVEEKAGFLSLAAWPAFIIKRRLPIIVVFSTISIAAIWMSFYNEVNSDPVSYFSKETALRKDFEFLKKHIKGIRTVDFVIDSGVTGGAKSPEFLNKVDHFMKELLVDPEIIQINSILDAIKKVNKQIENTQKESIPESAKKVAEVLLLYQMGLPASLGIQNQLSADNRSLRIRVKWNLESTKAAVAKEQFVYKVAKNYGLDVYAGGYFPIYTQMNNKVVDSFFKSMSMAILLVSLILFIIFRDFKIALLAMLPNVLPLTLGAAYTAIFGIYIDIGTSIVSAICLGIAVDDTIHFIVHFLKNKQATGDSHKALELTFEGTGRALVMTTLLLVVGFGSFIFADFLPNRNFGFLCALVLTFALLTDLLFLPAIMVSKSKSAV